MLSFPRVFQALALAAVLAACGTAPPAPSPEAAPVSAPAPVTAPALAPQPADGRIYRIDAQASRVQILVFRGGAAGRLGHNHVLSVPDLEGFVQVPERPGQGLGGARFELGFRLDAMQIDAPALRQALGTGWASVPSAEAIAGTRTNMLGEAGLQAERFPQVRIRSLQISGEAPRLAARIEVELHGRRREQWVPLEVGVSEREVRAKGALVVRQSDYGLVPFSVLGGLLSVRDELVVDFELVARADDLSR